MAIRFRSVSGWPGLVPLLVAVVAVVCQLSTSVLGWGLAGHQIVATIAQTQLHPLVRRHLCSILPDFTRYSSVWPPTTTGPPETHCHLAVLSGWPDTVRNRFPWSPRLHYVNPVDDHPPQHCTFGETGWTTNDNVLYAMVNYTERLVSQTGEERDLALRFLVHHVGDAHQPLHLTGRAHGGNDVWVHFEGRKAKLHSVWDGLILNKQIRELHNYTSQLPSPRIESALRGNVYDPYIRWILNEGLGQPTKKGGTPQGWFVDEAETWTSCEDEAASTTTVADAASMFGGQQVLSAWDPSVVDQTDLPVCPYHWTKLMHPLVCQYAFASPVPEWEDPKLSSSSSPNDEEQRYPRYPPISQPPQPELDTPEYLGRIDGDHVLQRQFAKAGLRLAAILNSLLLDEAKAAFADSSSSD